MKTSKIEQTPHCPKCHSLLDGAMHEGPEQIEPEPGDLSICIYCRALLEFNEQMGLDYVDTKKLSAEDLSILKKLLYDLEVICRVKNGIVAH